MARAIIEHVNITVSDPAQSAQMMAALFGWTIRWQGPARDGGHSVHVGDDTTYLAFYKPAAGAEAGPFRKGAPLNHVGLVVDDLEGVERKALALGLTPFNHGDYAPGRRFYVLDADGVEYEFVSYAPAQAAA